MIVSQVATLHVGGQAELCLLRDVCEEGLRAETYLALAPGDAIAVELRTGHRIAGRVARSEPPVIGMTFDIAVPIVAMLAHCAFDDRLARLRPPRIGIDLPVTVSIDGETIAGRATNISQEGVGLMIGAIAVGVLPLDRRCLVALPGLAPRPARTRWSHDGECGLRFEQPIAFGDFARWRRATPGRPAPKADRDR